MPDSLAEFLDDLTLHLESEIAKAPAPLAEALRREDAPFSTVEKLRILAQPHKVADLVGTEGAAAPATFADAPHEESHEMVGA